jgi:hypothetical protein
MASRSAVPGTPTTIVHRRPGGNGCSRRPLAKRAAGIAVREMKPIYGFWLIVINWTFGLLSRILFVITEGRAAWLGLFFYLSPVVNLALGLIALFIAYSAKMQTKYRIALVLVGLAMLIAGAMGLLSPIPYWWVQWPDLERTTLALGMILETTLIFGAVVLGLAGTTDLVKRFLILSVPTLRIIEILSDFQASPNVGLLVLFVVTLALLFGSYRLFTFAGSSA